MKIGDVDKNVIGTVLDTLSNGMKRVETETPDGRKVVGYCVTDKQIRIDIVEKK